MARDEFNTGDLVRLKSGGEIMTVKYQFGVEAAFATGEELGVHCDWHDRNGQAQNSVFRPEQIERAT